MATDINFNNHPSLKQSQAAPVQVPWPTCDFSKNRACQNWPFENYLSHSKWFQMNPAECVNSFPPSWTQLHKSNPSRLNHQTLDNSSISSREVQTCRAETAWCPTLATTHPCRLLVQDGFEHLKFRNNPPCDKWLTHVTHMKIGAKKGTMLCSFAHTLTGSHSKGCQVDATAPVFVFKGSYKASLGIG